MANEYLTTAMETLRPSLPEAYEVVAKDTLYGRLKKGGEDHKITKTPNGTDFRINLKMSRAGVYGGMNLAGGSFLTGTSSLTKQMYQTYFPQQLGFEINLENIWTTEDKSKAILNAFKDIMQEAPKTMSYYCNAGLHSIGSGYQGLQALSTAVTTVGGGTETVTCATANAANLITVGQRLEIFTNNLGSQRTSAIPDALPYVTAVNKSAGTFTIAGLGAITPAADDYYAFPGVGSTPSWVNGINYFHNTATSGNLLGLDRATYPELQPNKVNAAGALVPAHGWQLFQQIRQRTGEVGKMLGVAHFCQAYQNFALGLAMTTKLVSGNAVGAFDTAGDAQGKEFTFANVPHLIDMAHDKTRIDWLDLSNWGRVYLKELDFFKTPSDGQMIFMKRAATTAAMAAAIQFWMVVAENFYCAKPAGDGFAYALTIPSGF